MYAKTFPYAYVNTVLCLMEWKHLPHTCMQESHYYSESFTLSHFSVHPFPLFDLSSCENDTVSDSCITIKSAHFYTCVIKESFSTNWAHLRLRHRKRKNTGCCCQERSELIVWMFWNYIHFLFVHSAHLTPPQSTEPGDHATFIVCGVKVS